MVSGEDDEPSRPSGYYCWDDLRLEITNEINSVDSCELKTEIMSCDSIHSFLVADGSHPGFHEGF